MKRISLSLTLFLLLGSVGLIHTGMSVFAKDLEVTNFALASVQSESKDVSHKELLGASDVTSVSLQSPYFHGDWLIDCVDCPKYFSKMGERSLRLDADGRPHIAYGGEHLYYARFDGTMWHTEIVDPAPGVGAYASLALDAVGYPHISYYDETEGNLKYAHWTGSDWEVEAVASAGDVGQYTSLALDGADFPHISYFDATYEILMYTYWTGDAWAFESVDTDYAGWYTSLALDAAGNPHISYSQAFTYRWGYMRYAHRAGSGWMIQNVYEGGYWGGYFYTSLRLDAAGQPHIIHHNENLVYSSWTGSAWDHNVIDSSGGGPALALDALGYPHVSYYDFGQDTLKYAYWTGHGFEIQPLDGGGPYTSLALDAAGDPHISCYGQGSLTYVYRAGGAWGSWRVDKVGDSGYHTSLALDSSDFPHISYSMHGSTSAFHTLNYARWTGSMWDVQTVDDSDGGKTALALDSLDHPHIVYRGQEQGPLKYAHWTGSAWDIQVIGEVDSDFALAVDHNNYPHVVYRDVSDVYYIKYTRWTGSAWETQILESGNFYLPRPSSLAVDDLGYPHVGYTSGMYAHWTGVVWDTQKVVYGAVDAVMALDGFGKPHFIYYDDDEGHLKYAYRSGNAWVTQFVDSMSEVEERHHSLAVDAFGRPAVSYYDANQGQLKYARRIGGIWHIQSVKDSQDMGQYTSLALDASGAPHISFYDVMGRDLRYAYAAGTSPPLPELDKQATPTTGMCGNDTLTYTLTLSGAGLKVYLWDPLPRSLHYIPGSLTPPAIYSPTAHAVTWQGTLPTDTLQIRFQVMPGMTGTASLLLSPPIVNTAWLTDVESGVGVSARVIVNSQNVFLPLVMRER